MKTPPKAILLDVGGVFLLPSRDHIRSALAQVGCWVDDDRVIDEAHYRAVRAFPMDITDAVFLGPHWATYLRMYAGHVGVAPDLVDDAVEHLRNEYVTSELWTQVITGSKEGLAQLVATGIPIGVVSNSDGTIAERLATMEILQEGPGAGVEVVCVVDSGVVGVEKPDPAIFTPALEILGIEAEEVWYVGDTPAYDVVGARRARLHPFLMDPFGVNHDFGVPTVGSLTELVGRLQLSR